MDIDLSSIVHETLLDFAADIKEFLTNLVRNNRRIEADELGEYSENPEEAAQMDAEIDATEVEITVEDSSIAVEIVTSGSLYDKISTEGQPTAYSGGQGGTVTYPDEHTETSNVPVQMQGQPVENSEDPASKWKENSVTQIKSLLSGMLTEFVQNHLGSKMGPYIGQILQRGFA